MWLPLTPPTGDLAGNPGLCPDWESDWQHLGSQASAQSTEAHQPRLGSFFCVSSRAFFFLFKHASYFHLEKEKISHFYGLQGPEQSGSCPDLQLLPSLMLSGHQPPWSHSAFQAYFYVLLPQCSYKGCSIFLQVPNIL